MASKAAKRFERKFKTRGAIKHFSENKQYLGYTKSHAIRTVVHEALTNSLDVCEEDGVLPEIFIDISPNSGKNDYKVIIEDNGSGIPPKYVPRVFGEAFSGTKFQRSQQRGQQGIGIAGANLFAGGIRLKTSTNGAVHEMKVSGDEARAGEVIEHKTRLGEFRGTRLEFDLDNVKYNGNRKYGILNYLRLTSLANPHARIEFSSPSGETHIFERRTHEVPEKSKEVLPHPNSIDANTLREMSKETDSTTLRQFITNGLQGISWRKWKRDQGESLLRYQKKIARAY